MQFWLVKQEPASYSWDDFVKEKLTSWTGVRNYEARNNLARMKKGDSVFFYHSGEDKAIVGLASVARPAYPDPTSDDDKWVAVDLKAGRPLGIPVTLQAIKDQPSLQNVALLKRSRLSVLPLLKEQFEAILSLGDLSELLQESARRLSERKTKKAPAKKQRSPTTKKSAKTSARNASAAKSTKRRKK